MITLLDRLSSQLSDEYKHMSPEESQEMASDILIKRGHLNEDGSLTAEGIIRQNMSPEERAIDRRIKERGGNREDYVYDYESNTVKKTNA